MVGAVDDVEALGSEVEDRLERRHQAQGAGLDLEQELAVPGLALVEGLGQGQALEGPRSTAGPAASTTTGADSIGSTA